jgi:hypothetical protein
MTSINRMLATVALTLFVFALDGLARGGFRGGGVAVGGARGGAAYGARGGAAIGPYGGVSSGYRSGGTVVGPAGGSASRVSGSGSYTGPRGGSIDYGGAARGATGPLGGQAGRYVGGVQVTTPGGQTATKVGTGAGVRGPAGNAVGGRTSIGGTTGPYGSAAGISRSGTAIGPAGAIHGGYQGGVAVGPHGVAAGGTRGVVATRPGGTVVAGGYRGGVAARGTYYVSRDVLRTQGTYVRRSFNYYHCFTPNWYARYPGAWYTAGWVAGRAWTAATWPTLAVYCGYPAQPVYYYDYGSTVTYQGDNVYMDGEPVATAAQYAQQATQIADAGRAVKPPEQEEWQSLGVFAMVKGEEESSDKIFQLAINKDGLIRGNYYDAIADNTTPVYGSVDKKTQRAAWSIGEKKDIVFEAGIANLTQEETPVLVHYGKDNTQQFTLVRVEQSGEAK